MKQSLAKELFDTWIETLGLPELSDIDKKLMWSAFKKGIKVTEAYKDGE